MSRVLVTGGAGYIGGTTVALLLQRGFEVTVLDDCSTGHADSVPAEATFYQGSILDGEVVRKALAGCDAVIHFAAKSLVGESVEKPDLYRNNNIGGSQVLFDEMDGAGNYSHRCLIISCDIWRFKGSAHSRDSQSSPD
jgi:UDP-glucose 4-epimerase